VPRTVYGINIIAVEHGQQTNVEFSADYTFKEGDTVAVIGKVAKIDKFEKEM
jgi:trk system potassium uptake protein TrkA